MSKNISEIIYQLLSQQFSRPTADDSGRGKPLTVGWMARGFCRGRYKGVKTGIGGELPIPAYSV
jgi:hypothetical protein